jgi:hypothetical protein
MRQHAKQVQCIRLPRFHGQDLTVDRFSLGESTSVLMLDSQIQAMLNVI